MSDVLSDSMGPPLPPGAAPVSLRQIIYQRRSAVALDGRTSITRDAFCRILAKTLAGPGQFPFAADGCFSLGVNAELAGYYARSEQVKKLQHHRRDVQRALAKASHPGETWN